jgi:carbonic anhydrase/acetyltransferase-like protein (isoleucine patch superfamily)
MIYQLEQLRPQIHPDSYVSPEATVIGNVTLEAGATAWPGAVLRGDNAPIVIGAGSNIQDGSVLHNDPGIPLTLGRNVSVGHMAMLHGCTVEDGALIGIRAVVLNRAVIGKNSLVGAGALVTEGKVIPEGSLVLGAPAKVVRALTPEEIAGLQEIANHYVERGRQYSAGLKPLSGSGAE